MADAFDAYHFWLGIPPAEQPPDHYRLLGVARFEADQQAIATAFQRRMSLLTRFQSGDRAALAQKLIEDLANAWACLLNPEQKRRYDEQLGRRLAGQAALLGFKQTHKPAFATSAAPPAPAAEQMPQLAIATAAAARPARLRRSLPRELAKHVVASAVGLVLGYIAVCQFSPRFDFLGIWHAGGPHENVGAQAAHRVNPSAAPAAHGKPANRAAPHSAAAPPRGVAQPGAAPNKPPPSRGSVAGTSESQRPPKEPAASRPVASAPPVRLFLPTQQELDQATKLVQEAYKPSFELARSMEERVEFARQLLRDGTETLDDPVGRYALWQQARDIAAQAAHWELAFDAARHIGKHYDASVAAQQAEIIAEIEPQMRQPEEFRSLLEGVEIAFDAAVAEDRYDLAVEIASVGSSAAQRAADFDLWREAADRATRAEMLAREYETAREALAAVAGHVGDEAAHQTAGRFLCFAKQDWSRGLPLLARAANEPLRSLARRDQAAPSDASQQVALADAWWEHSAANSGVATTAMRGRAVHWYRMAVPQLTGGLTKVRVEKRIAEMQRGRAISAGPSKPELPTITTAMQLERTAQQQATAKHALLLYQQFLDDRDVDAAEKDAARERLDHWREAAANDLVRLGVQWKSREEAIRARDEARRLFDESLELLGAGEGPLARERLKQASRADPSGVLPDFLLGVLYAVDGRDLKQAQTHFTVCLRRQPEHPFALNNLGLAAVLNGDHSRAHRQMRRAMEHRFSVPEVIHNAQRIFGHHEAGRLPLLPVQKTFLIESIEQAGAKPLEDRGLIYLLPRSPSDAKLVETLNRSKSDLIDCSITGNAVWLEDCACVACRGRQKVVCGNRGCSRGTILVTVNFSRPVIDKNTGRLMSGKQQFRRPCPACKGTGLVDCGHCQDGSDPGLP